MFIPNCGHARQEKENLTIEPGTQPRYTMRWEDKKKRRNINGSRVQRQISALRPSQVGNPVDAGAHCRSEANCARTEARTVGRKWHAVAPDGSWIIIAPESKVLIGAVRQASLSCVASGRERRYRRCFASCPAQMAELPMRRLQVPRS